MTVNPPIALVGVGGIFPDAPTLDQFWNNIERGVCAAREVPPGRWALSVEEMYDPTRGVVDKVYSKRGCYITGFELDPEGLNLDPNFIKALDPVFHLALHAAREALRDANLKDFDRHRTGVILGSIALPTEKTSAITAEILGRTFEEKVLTPPCPPQGGIKPTPCPSQEGNVPTPCPSQEGNVSPPLPMRCLSAQAGTQTGQGGNFLSTYPINKWTVGLVAGIIAKALNLGGGSYTIDGACAASLYALNYAVFELQAGRADVMLTGGVCRPDSSFTQMGFCQLRALSPTGVCAPFDEKGNGLVVGEGAGMFVLKRLDDALRDGDHIYAVIRGIGLSNDRQGALLAPDSEGQVRAMRMAYQQAGWSPQDMDFIECHATGTPVGDAVEFTSLKTLWENEDWQPNQCVLGGIKANIGHLLTGAGAAGLIKVVLALKHHTLPPMANFSTPDQRLDLPNSPFQILTQAQSWEKRDKNTPRRAAVSAFGFGGINAHVLLEEWESTTDGHHLEGGAHLHSPEDGRHLEGGAHRIPAIAIVGMDARFGPWTSLRAFQERVLGGGEPVEPTSPNDWWGVEQSEWFKSICSPGVSPGKTDGDVCGTLKGYFIDKVSIPFGQFRIPPKEIEDTLPQQLLMLQVAAEALTDARIQMEDNVALHTGVFIGIGLDLNSTNFSFRWKILEKAKIWAARLKLNLSPDELNEWVQSLRDVFAPPLTANRTVGSLGGIVASRIAREFHCGGPGITISSEETSGLRALEVAVRSLQHGEIDQAIVGAVDLNGDVRSILCTQAERPFSISGRARPFDEQADGSLPGEGAAAVVLKRLDDAIRDGNKIYAVIKGIGIASGQVRDAYIPDTTAYRNALESAYHEANINPMIIQYLETHGSGYPQEDQMEATALTEFFSSVLQASRLQIVPQASRLQSVAQASRLQIPKCALGSIKADIGHTGAAAGLASLVKTCLCLYQEIIPPMRNLEDLVSILKKDSTNSFFYFPTGSQYWLRNRAEGPRRAGVSSFGIDGNCVHVVLEECTTSECSTGVPARSSRRDARGATSAFLQPLGARNEALFAVEADNQSALVARLQHLKTSIEQTEFTNIEAFAREWWGQNKTDSKQKLGLALIARDISELRDQIEAARQAIMNRAPTTFPGNRMFYTETPIGITGEVAFVFPGSGNHYLGLGRSISSQWPEILRRQDAENQYLRGQYVPDLIWNKASLEDLNCCPQELLLAQVAYSTMMTDLLRNFGIYPDAVIGYSLGESSGLFSLRAWTARDEMLQRILNSTLFTKDLAGEYRAAYQAWNLPDGEAVDWMIAAVHCSAKQIHPVLEAQKRVYLLIINTPDSCVIGGDRLAVMQVIEKLGCNYQPLQGVSTAHCEVIKHVEQAYRELHRFDTTIAPPGVRFYSGAWRQVYDINPDSAADAISAQAAMTVDFPGVIQQAYKDGVRVFVEIGPSNTCTNMIDKILTDRPHVAASVCAANYEDVSTILRLLGKLIAERVPVDLTRLYGHETQVVAHQAKIAKPAERTIDILTGGQPFQIVIPKLKPVLTPEIPESTEKKTEEIPKYSPSYVASQQKPITADEDLQETSVILIRDQQELLDADMLPEVSQNARQIEINIQSLLEQTTATQISTGQAHEAYLKFSQGMTETYSNQLAFQMSLIESMQKSSSALRGGEQTGPQISRPQTDISGSEEEIQTNAPQSQETHPFPLSRGEKQARCLRSEETVFMTREQCLEFAIGSIAKVLGEEFAEIDNHPTRVRLPGEPLMLVDRIIEVEGEPRSLTHGRVVTEHDIFPDDWYLDCGRIPTCIAVESGQADLFLSGYLGIDFVTKGLAVYRLLDAAVTFHRPLPGPGSVLRYDIHIDDFFRQGNTYLFHFRFDCMVDGELLLTMRNGCAGFFTQRELNEGQGLVFTKMDLQPMPGKTPDDWPPFAEIMTVESYSDAQVEALRNGDLAGCFGSQFQGLLLQNPCRLPGGLITLVHRILSLDPNGGRYGLGQIRGEADIHPDDWFLTCHFVDDMVMPGTLMYECCLQTLRILLMRMGWVGEQHEISWEPVPGVAGQLQCRGQVIATTKKVIYEVSIKEIGYHPEPYVISDAIMYADNKPIVRMIDMSLQLSGMTREKLETVWANRESSLTPPLPPLKGGLGKEFPSREELSSPFEGGRGDVPKSPLEGGKGGVPQYYRKPAIFDHDKILAFAIGKPSEAFGDRYKVFDKERVIARLPGPPYQFLDRITAIQGEQWVMTAEKIVEAQYDVPPEEWYFASNRHQGAPFCVLLEIVLQPCGWLAAYVGSALTCDVDLSFRNLGGRATQFLPVEPDIGTLTTVTKMTSVSQSGGMIIQHYDYELTNGAGQVIYKGTTYFGFFTKQALAHQIGIRDTKPYQPTPEEIARGESFVYPTEPPFPDSQLRMVDWIDLFVPDGGPYGLGLIRGIKNVMPDEWFFKAHFYQDPVWPGSLGLEALLQLLKVAAVKRWGWQPPDRFETMVLNHPHQWTYRGQVIPTDHQVTIQAVLTSVDDTQRSLEAEGFLIVDGRIIYQMEHFTLRIR